MDMYTAVIALTILAMCEMLVLVHENARMSADTKKYLYILHTLVICSALAEWFGFRLDGAPSSLILLHRIIKATDLSISPFIGYTFVHLLTPDGIWEKLSGILSFSNIGLQIIGIFTGSFAYIDSNNVYSEGPLYFIYMVIYVAAILFIAAALYSYGSKYRKRNLNSLYMCAFTTFFGIFLQEITGETVRTANLSIGLGTMIIFIHYNEYIQMEEDEIRDRLDEEAHTDTLTGILNRQAYEEKLQLYENPPLPEDLAIFSIDVNGLKEANDHQGHEAGDEILRLSSQVMTHVLEEYGDCYRIGGDEFTAIVHLPSISVETITKQLREGSAAVKRRNGKPISIAIGCASASEHPDYSLHDLAILADRRMYQDKERYYHETGHNRRRK
jgi:diguanylate cyclase (GGDEF)-like protein